MMNTFTKLTTMIPGLFLLAACSTGEREITAPPAQTTPVIAVSAYPIAYFAERIAGPDAEVRLVVPNDENPAEWQPTAGDIAIFQEADLILFNGATLEDWSRRATLPTSKIVNTSSAFRDNYIIIKDAVMHHHGDGHMHSHDGIDPHTWLDPIQALQQTESIRRAITDLIPGSAGDISERYIQLDADLKELHTKFMAATEPLRETPILASHPVYDYFARRYRLSVRSLHLEPDLFPSEDEWIELDEHLAEEHSPIMLWEDYPLAETITELANRGVTIVVFHTCASKPDDANFMEAMNANAQRLIDAHMVLE